MNEMNAARALVRIVKEICAARGIRLSAFSNDWVFCLQKNGRTAYVIGYDFGLNSATAKMICKDKAATSDLLAFHGVPRVEHRIFHGPQMAGYVPLAGNWRPMLAFFEECGGDVVCKPNEGTGGRNVFRARNAFELEAAVMQIFSKSRSLCLSPFETISGEYRVAIIEGRIQFVYLKMRPALAGDGTRTVQQLLLDRMAEAPLTGEAIAGWESIAEIETDFGRVPARGETVPINWRHNLGQGALPEPIDEKNPAHGEIASIALKATEALGVSLASVDVVATQSGLKVLEINSGIMMESLVLAPGGKELACRFYDKIICRALDLP